VEPTASLYYRNEFSLEYPEGVDLSRVPYDLWWLVALMCLHPHWPLLRPCRVHMPVQLDAADKEVLLRLMDARVATLETYRGGDDFGRAVEINDFGLPLQIPVMPPQRPRCAAAFSGGKDSLLQAGLLAELTERPVLVSTTSPLPGLADHTTERRKHILKEVPRRRSVDLVEVKSDFRSNFDNSYSAKVRGYGVSVNELTDTLFYSAAMLGAAAAMGADHLFLASEAEVQENTLVDGRVIEHPHCMYSTVTLRAWSAILGRYGFHYSSLQPPLHSQQVQALLWTRYPDLCDLQYSCWRVPEGKAACSRCNQCLRVGFTSLELDDSPARMGVDMVSLMIHRDDWGRQRPAAADAGELAGHKVRRELWEDTARVIQGTRWRRLAGEILRQPWRRWRDGEVPAALRNAWRFKRRIDGLDVGGLRGYRPLFLSQVDGLLRDGVAAIYAEHFAPEDEGAYLDVLERSERLAAWVTAPVDAAGTGAYDGGSIPSRVPEAARS
jgi:hypothetical protein